MIFDQCVKKIFKQLLELGPTGQKLSYIQENTLELGPQGTNFLINDVLLCVKYYLDARLTSH